MRILLRYLPLSAALALIPSAASADTAESVLDPRYGLTFRAGFLQASDDQFETTWLRPGLIEGSAWLVRARRHWFAGIQVNASMGLQSSEIKYREHHPLSNGRYGLGSCDVAVPFGPLVSLGAHATIFENDRLRLLAFAGLTTPPGMPDARAETVEVDAEGMLIDVTDLIRAHAAITMAERTYRAGLTFAVSLSTGRERWVPYVSFGYLRYRASIDVVPDDELARLIETFGGDPSSIRSTRIAISKPFLSPGLRLDVGRRWTFEVQPLLGRYDGAWVFATQAGATLRFGS